MVPQEPTALQVQVVLECDANSDLCAPVPLLQWCGELLDLVGSVAIMIGLCSACQPSCTEQLEGATRHSIAKSSQATA